jgi:hypothetical protein
MASIGGGTHARLAHSTVDVSMIVPASINLAPTGQPAPAIWYFILGCLSVAAFGLPCAQGELPVRGQLIFNHITNFPLGRRELDRAASL